MADFVDGLVAFDLEAVQKHIDEMRPGGFIIFDNTSEKIPDAAAPRRRLPGTRCRSEDRQSTTSASSSSATRSRSASSARSSAWIRQIVRDDVATVYQRKGEKVVDLNIARDRGRRERTSHEHFAGRPTGIRARSRRRRRSPHHDGQRRDRLRRARRAAAASWQAIRSRRRPTSSSGWRSTRRSTAASSCRPRTNSPRST